METNGNIGLKLTSLAVVNTSTPKMVGGLVKVKQNRRHRRWSLVQPPSQSLLQVGSYTRHGSRASESSTLASYHAVELCRPCTYLDLIPLAFINILVGILTHY